MRRAFAEHGNHASHEDDHGQITSATRSAHHVPEFEWNPQQDRVRVGVSLPLEAFNARLDEHGQCSLVRLGGHVQTGGYGMLARSSGLFSDYIESIELLIADGKDRFIWRESQDPEDTDLYFAVLGRSPDSFDLLIHGLQFIQPHSRLRLEWQQRNAEEALGGKTFSEEEPRMFWGIYGNKDLRARWPHYIDSREVRAPLRDQTARRAGGDLFAE